MCSPADRRCHVYMDEWQHVEKQEKPRKCWDLVSERQSVDSNSHQIYRPPVVYVHTKLNEVCSKHKPVSLPNQLSSPSAQSNTQRVTGERKGNKLGSHHRKSWEWTEERGALYKASPTLLSGPLMWHMSKQDGCKTMNQSAIWAARQLKQCTLRKSDGGCN